MGSKFKNRLIGMIVLVALCVILLPGLLDGNKHHYNETVVAIPLIAKEGDEQNLDPIPQIIPMTPPRQGNDPLNTSTVPESNAADVDMPESNQAADSSLSEPSPYTQSVQSAQSVRANPVQPPASISEPQVQKPKAPAVPSDPKPIPSTQASAQPAPQPDRPPVPQPSTESPPTGDAYVVQLGALKNADKVNEIIAKLRLSGHRAYTVPSRPVTGQLTRIYVGPDMSREALQQKLGDLQALTGLSGQVRRFDTRQ